MSVKVRAPIDPSQVRFQLGEGHLDRVEVRAVGRQEQEPASGLAHDFVGSDILVRGEVVQNDYGARFKFRHQNLLNVRSKGFAIHGTLDDPRCNQCIRCQTSDERLRSP